MEATYVVIGDTQSVIEDEKTVLYAGQEKAEALSHEVDTYYRKLYIQIWVNGIVFKRLEKTSIADWKVVYDKIQSLEESVVEKKVELSKAEKELNELKSLYDGE